ncbi:MAG TPA: NUDIX hydrolase [Oligoflexus sp.]|uniref:NUDIX hydrolase n=1 Tax=Oligoflexus sp. TaxID=1971216 RepID=UPI002D5024E2|nr:NUDIX hydrolase [Oligoflexus sp.]HYX38287.1 NUDIX hydrolase [Oligoflexus sp.]
MDWSIEHKKILAQTPVFQLEEVSLIQNADRKPVALPYYRIHTRSWVNVFALTKDSKAILVRQPRVGMMQMTLEVPGGGIDTDEDPAAAAARELEEETGYRAGSLEFVGVVSPNPAIMTNRLHMFLARDCYMPPDRQHFPDLTERIEVRTLSLAELDATIKEGGIHNALAALTILMSRRFLLND